MKTVRPLDWKYEGEVARALTPFGETVVGKIGIRFGWVHRDVTGWNPARSMGAAIVDAEADFHRRVLECLLDGEQEE